MRTLKEMRAQYPKKYAGRSDEELANAVHAKQYPEMPREQFDKEFGLSFSLPHALGQFGRDVQNTSVVRAGTSFADALGNIPIAIGNTLASPVTDERVAPMDTQGGQGWAEAIGTGAGNAFGLLGLGAGLENMALKGLTALSKHAPSTSKYISQLTGAASPTSKAGKAVVGSGQAGGRIGLAGTESALLNADETAGAAEEAALIQSLFEITHPTIRAGAKSLEAIPGYKYMEDMLARMQQNMNNSQAESSELFGKAEKAGAGKVLNIQEAIPGTPMQPSKLDLATMGYTKEIPATPGTPAQTTLFTEQLANKPFEFNKQAEESYAAFIENPNYENAFKLQSDLGFQSRDIKAKGYGDNTAKKKIDDARAALNKDIEMSLLGENSEAAGFLKSAMQKYAMDVAPTKANAKFKQIQEGVMGPQGFRTREGAAGIPSIKEMQKFLTKELTATKKDNGYRFPETHAFHKELAGLNKRGEQSQLAQFNPMSWPLLGIQALSNGRVDPFTLLKNQQFLALADALGTGLLKQGGVATSAYTPGVE